MDEEPDVEMDWFQREVGLLKARFEESRRVRAGAAGDPAPLDALEEMATALEELRVAEEELRAQNDQLIASRRELELANKRYRELFEFAPGGYLVTDPRGVIEDANYMAATLVGRTPAYLVGKPVTVFFQDGERSMIRQHLLDLETANSGRVFESRVVNSGGMVKPVGKGRTPSAWVPVAAQPDSTTVMVTIEPVPAVAGEPRRLRWLIVDTTAIVRAREKTQEAAQGLAARLEEHTAALREENRRLRERLGEAGGAAGAG